MIKQQLQKDQIAAMKAGDKDRLNTIRYIVSQIKNKEIDAKQELSDEEVIQLLRKQIKQLHDSNESFAQGNRQDLIDENTKQITIISEYLPPEISDEGLEQELDHLIAQHKEAMAANPKAIIGIAIKELKPKAAPGRINACLKKKGLM